MGTENTLDEPKQLEFNSIFASIANAKDNDEILQIFDFISFNLRHFDLSFLNISQLQFFFIHCSGFIKENFYLEPILICLSSFSFQSAELINNIIYLNFPFFEFFFDSLFSKNFDFEFIIDTISFFAQKNIVFQENIISILLLKGGFHSILSIMYKTKINENKVYSFSNFLHSISIFPIYSIAALDDIFECVDTVLQSQFTSSFLRIFQTVKNILLHLIDPIFNAKINNTDNKNSNDDEESFDDTNYNSNSIEYILDSFNNHFIIEQLFSKIDENEELIKYACISAGLLRYRCNINEQVDLQTIVNFINSPNDDIVICSSRCFADFCYLDPSFSAEFFNIDYYISLLKKFELFSNEQKINTSFQIVIFSQLLPLEQLFELCQDTSTYEVCLMPIFSQIARTLSVSLLDLLLRLYINITDYSISIAQEEEINKDEFFDTLIDIQSSDIFGELEQTEIPELINLILDKSNLENSD